MSRLRVFTRLAPGLWLSQRISCGGCIFMAAIVACPLICVATWAITGFLQVVQAIIPMWGR